MEKCISQSQYLFYSDANVPYRGFVEGIGYVDSMYKDYVIAPSYSDIMTPGSPMYGQRDTFIQSIGYIPSVDSSPSMVMKSYGKDAAKKIEEHLVKYNGGNVSVNLGDKILNLSPKNKYRISSDIKNEYRNDATYSIDIYYEDEKGSYKLNNTYLLNDIPGFFPFTDWQDLYTCQPESYSMSQAVDTAINLNQKKNNIPQIPSNIPPFSGKQEAPQHHSLYDDISEPLDKILTYSGYGAGASGLAFSYSETLTKASFLRDVEEFKARDVIKIRDEFRPQFEKNIESTLRNEAKRSLKTEPYKAPNGQSIKFFNKHGSLIKKRRDMYNKAIQSAYKTAHNQAAEQAIVETERVVESRTPGILEKLNKGVDPRVATKFKVLSCLRVINPVLNVIGATVSSVSFVKQGVELSTGRQNVNWRTIGKTLKLAADVAFSIVAFVGAVTILGTTMPGWLIAGGWFLASTAVDMIWDACEGK